VSGNYFIARWISGVNFARPIVVGSDSQLSGRIAVLQLYNSATNGTQTFSGPISGKGRVERTGATTSPGGTTVFTGDNTYSGGTIISYGTALANNVAGSALGSGTVTVTNLGVLGGNGTIAATVTAGLNGTLSPGTSPTDVANLNITDLKLEDGAHYLWQIKAATGTPGVDWDLMTVNSSVWEAGTGTTPITIKVDSLGAAPTGWNPSTARDWLIISSGWIFGYDPSHFALDTTAFAGNMAGVFSLSLDGSGLHLVYTPAPDLMINVASGTQTQAEAGYPYITGALGMAKIGNGELVLDNPGNDYLGSTKILAGVLSLSASAMNGWGTLGAASTAAYLGHASGDSNATLNINVDGVTMARGIVVQSGSSGTKTIGTALTSGTATYSGDVALQDGATLSAATGGTAQFNGSFSGAGGLALSGGGTIGMSGLGSYAGPTSIGVAVLNLNSAALGTNTVTIASPLTLDNTAGAVTLNTCPQIWNADFTFVGTSSLNLGAGPITLGGSRAVNVNNSTLTVGGPISGNAGLTKAGGGTLALMSASAYTGGTTNLAGVLAVNGTATFGDGGGALVLAGGNIACTASHEATPIANPVVMTTDATIYGTSMATAPSSSYLPFTGPFSVTGGSSLKIGNTGRANNTFAVRLQGPNFSLINWPIVIGDAGFDTAGTISQLDFYSDTNAPAQFVNGLVSGTGLIRRGAAAPNTGGTTILTAPNTFSGGAHLTSGALGLGTDSVSSGGLVTAGPLGTALFTIGDQTVSETNMTVFAWGGPRVIENPIFLNGARNVIVAGTNDLTFTGAINAGGIPKKWTVVSTGRATLAGQITSNAGSDGAPLTKAGDGVLVLRGDNLYTGATTVAEGTLLVNNTTGSGTGPNNVTVQAAGTIGGTGTVAGRITASGGRVAPGESVGTLTVGNGVNFSSGGTYVWELGANSTDPGSGDLLNVTGGNVVLGGSSRLAIGFTGSATAPDPANAFWQSEQTWTILALSGPAANPGPTQFASIENSVFAGGSFTNYADAGGNIILKFAPGGPSQPEIEPNIIGAGTADAQLTWSAVNGLTYRVQYKTNLNQPGWLTLGDVPATGSTASIHDTTGPWPERYYRVIIP
jgi:autotransporter-associated beta strand protein